MVGWLLLLVLGSPEPQIAQISTDRQSAQSAKSADSSESHPGDTLWVRRFNGPGNHDDFPTGIMSDSNGNVIVTGYTFSMATDFNFVTLKYDSIGQLTWSRVYGSPRNSEDRIWSACLDRAGNIYVTGGSIADTVFNWDYLTIKYRPDGETCWMRRFDSPFRAEDKARAIAVDDSGNVLVTGWSRSTQGSFDYLTVKCTSSGDTVWTRRFDGPAHQEDEALGLAVDRWGDVIVTGKSADENKVPQIVTIKYDAQGRVVWQKTARGSGRSHNWPCAVKTDSLGNVFAAGTVSSAGKGYDYWLGKYDRAGKLLWSGSYDGAGQSNDIANGLALGANGRAVVAGQSMGKQTFYDHATVAWDATTGETLWTRRYDGPVHGDDRAQALWLDAMGNCCVTGSSVQTRPFESFLTVCCGANGDSLWLADYPAEPAANSRAVGVVGFGSRLYVVGYAYEPSGHADIVLISYRR